MSAQPQPTRTALALAAIVVLAMVSGCGGDKSEAMLSSARDYLAKNDPKAAVIQLKNALEKNPELADARLMLGQALLRGGDAVGAETELRKALALKLPAEQVAPYLAQALLRQGQGKKLTDEFASTELRDPAAQANLKTSLASAFAIQGKADLSKAALAAAFAADPAYAPALIFQAQDKATQRDYEGALAIVDGLIAKNPANAEALKLKGDIQLYGQGKVDDALATYRKSIEARSDYAEGRGAVFTTLLRKSDFDGAAKELQELKKIAPKSVQPIYFEALLAYQKKDFKHAREVAQQLIRLAPEVPTALQLAGAIEFQLNSLVQAEVFLAKGLQLAPDNVAMRRLLSTVYLRSGQSAKTLSTIQPLLKAAEVDSMTNSMAGEAYLQSGEAAKAEEYFAKAVKQDPKNIRARTSIALSHMASGKEEAAFNELQSIAESDTSTTADMALISVHLKRQEFDKALKAIDGLEKKKPDSPMASNLRGRVLLAKKDSNGARKSFERALQIDPAYFAAVASLAAIDMADKKPDDARKRFEAVLAKDPKNAPSLLALAEMKARSGGTKEEVADLVGKAIAANPTEVTARLLLVDHYLRHKDAKKALEVAQNAVAAIPDNAGLLDALARAQQASGDMNQALTSYSKAAALQPLSPVPQMRIAEAHLARQDRPAATQALRKALEIKPDLLEAQRLLVRLLVDQGSYDEAVRYAKTVQQQRPKEAVGYELEGDVSLRQKKWAAAADVFRSALKQGAFSSVASQLHYALTADKKTQEAENFAATWLKDHPRDFVFVQHLGDTASSANDYAGAEAQYLKSLQIQPSNPVALNNLAWVQGMLKKPSAIEYAEKANKLVPNQPSFMDTLAMLLSEKGDYAKAVEVQGQALALQPQNGSLRLTLAKIHIKGGKKDLARKELEELGKLGDKFQGQAEAAALLKSL